MYDRSQLMRGTLEGCILKILQKERTYGYDLVLKLLAHGFCDVREGTIYPLLLRLENKGMISFQYCPSPLGPARKYYSLTPQGTVLLGEFKTCWDETTQIVESIFSEGASTNEK